MNDVQKQIDHSEQFQSLKFKNFGASRHFLIKNNTFPGLYVGERRIAKDSNDDGKMFTVTKKIKTYRV